MSQNTAAEFIVIAEIVRAFFSFITDIIAIMNPAKMNGIDKNPPHGSQIKIKPKIPNINDVVDIPLFVSCVIIFYFY